MICGWGCGGMSCFVFLLVPCLWLLPHPFSCWLCLLPWLGSLLAHPTPWPLPTCLVPLLQPPSRCPCAPCSPLHFPSAREPLSKPLPGLAGEQCDPWGCWRPAKQLCWPGSQHGKIQLQTFLSPVSPSCLPSHDCSHKSCLLLTQPLPAQKGREHRP